MEKSGQKYKGTQLEQFVEQLLIEKDYTFIPRQKFKPATYIGQKIYSKHADVGKSIYELNMSCHFILYHPIKYPNCLIIETKWQQSGGTVDEKFPYDVLNIQKKYPHQTILILDGEGYRKGAENWIKGQEGNNLIHVFNMSEFQVWVNKGNI